MSVKLRTKPISRSGRVTAARHLEALRQHASALTGGIPSSIPSSNDEEFDPKMRGPWNFHFPLYFDDGRAWICRIRRQHHFSPILSMQNVLIEGEVVVLRFLSSTNLPVPQVHEFAPQSPGNPVGIEYMLIDMMDGTPLNWESKKTT